MKFKKPHFLLFLAILFAIISIYSATANTTQSIEVLEQQLSGADNVQRISLLNELSMAYLAEKELSKAQESAYESWQQAEKLSDTKKMVDASMSMGHIYMAKNDDENALEVFYRALDLSKRLDDKNHIAQATNAIGEVLLLREEVLKAMELFREAQQLMEELNDNEGLANVYKNMGAAYMQKETPEYGPAKDYYTRSFKIKLQLNDYESAAKTARLIADYDMKLKDYESAMIYLRSTMETYQGLGDQYNIAEVYHAMAEVYRLQGFPEDARNLYANALSIRQGIDDKVGIADTYRGIGMNELALGNESEATQVLSLSAQTLEGLPIQKEIPVIYSQISASFEKLGQLKESLTYQKKFVEAREQFVNMEKKRAALDLATMYASKFETEELRKAKEKSQMEEQFAKNKSKLLIWLIVLALALLAVAYYSYIRKQQDNNLLVVKNAEIEQKNKEIEQTNAKLDNLNGKLVNEMAERESVEQSSFARDRFLATMSNEMRTPLNIISGLTHILLTNEPRKDQVENLRTLQFSANNLVVFINDVLDFSNIEAGKISFESVQFNPRNTFDEIKERFSLPARDKGVELSIAYDSKIPNLLNGDPARLNQVVTNLVSTSLKYTDEGSVEIGMKVHELKNDKLTMLVTVKDSGQGIDKEKLETMFRKFSRSAEDMYDGYGSSGIGLAICKRLVDLQNGHIEAYSIVGEGTEFKVYLPYTLVEEKVEDTPKEKKSYTHLEGHKVLLVEDNKINQLVVAKMLKKLGIMVTTADNGQEALDALGESYFDLVLMDIQMPIMDGYRTTAEIRKSMDARVRDLPIIALTASAYLTEKEKAKLFGMDDHVGKPFGPEDLLDKISYHLRSRMAARN